MLSLLIVSFTLIVISTALSIEGLKTAIIIFALVGITISLGIKHRIKRQWRWQGVEGVDLLKAISISSLYILMLLRLFVNMFYAMNRDNGRGEFNWQPENRFNPRIFY